MVKDKTFNEFLQEFNIVENALDMRMLERWNGRDFRRRENLAEHTHLVVACAIDFIDKFESVFIPDTVLRPMYIVKAAMIHDSVELLRGDILSITKDEFPVIRDTIEREEMLFEKEVVGELTDIERDIVKLSDLKACYLFLERELRYPNNDFVKYAYIRCKNIFDDRYAQFTEKYGLTVKNEVDDDYTKFVKGYAEDAGMDVILDVDVDFMPMSTCTFGLNVKVTPKEGTMSILCSRTSAAAKGLCVALCPVDPNYNGEVMAIVHNISNNIISYKKGEAFCQVVTVPIGKTNIGNEPYKIKKQGKRSDGKLGSTGR